MRTVAEEVAFAEFRERLSKLCGMLGSDRDGERSNAARLIGHALANEGLTWPWLADLVRWGVLPGDQRAAIFHQLLGERLADGIVHAWAMSPSEGHYVRSMAQKNSAQLEATETASIAEAIKICDEAKRRAGAPGRLKPAR